MRIVPGSILLTSSVGGTDGNWRNRMISQLIISAQKIIDMDGKAEYSHAELLTDSLGSTFAARWRTRERPPDKGLDAYIGSKVMIAEFLSANDNWLSSYMEIKRRFDGDSYPLRRLAGQAATLVLPRWLVKINFTGAAICSEVVGYRGVLAGVFDYWTGMMPADIENQCRQRTSVFRIRFEGIFPGIDKYRQMQDQT
jgi:hypothetical protein